MELEGAGETGRPVEPVELREIIMKLNYYPIEDDNNQNKTLNRSALVMEAYYY